MFYEHDQEGLFIPLFTTIQEEYGDIPYDKNWYSGSEYYDNGCMVTEFGVSTTPDGQKLIFLPIKAIHRSIVLFQRKSGSNQIAVSTPTGLEGSMTRGDVRMHVVDLYEAVSLINMSDELSKLAEECWFIALDLAALLVNHNNGEGWLRLDIFAAQQLLKHQHIAKAYSNRHGEGELHYVEVPSKDGYPKWELKIATKEGWVPYSPIVGDKVKVKVSTQMLKIVYNYYCRKV